jgi:outer membrane protein
VILGGLALLAPLPARPAEAFDNPPSPPAASPAAPADEGEAAAERILEDAVGPAPGARTIGLGEAVALALESNYTLLQAADAVTGSNYRFSAAMAQFYPKLTPSYERSADDSALALRGRQLLPWTGGSLAASANFRSVPQVAAPLSRNSAVSFTLSQPLLRGFGPNASLYDLRNSRRDREGRERGFELERQRLALDVARAFYQVLEQRTLLSVARQSLVRTTALVKASEARLQVGLVSKLDVFRAELQSSQAQESMVRAESALQDALERFRFLLGREPAEALEPAAVALSADLPPAEPQPLVALIEAAKHARLDLDEARSQVDDARRTASLTKQNLLPQLDLNVGYTHEGWGPSFSSAWNAADQRLNVYFTASYPIERSTDLTNKALSEVALTASHRALRQRELLIETEVRAAVRDLEQIRKSVELQKKGVEVAQQQLRLATLRYQRGLASNFDVVDAESALVQARSTLVGLLSRFQIARVELLRVTGTLKVETEFQ